MKKTLLLAAVLVLAACGKKAETPAADTTSAITPEATTPATPDTAMMSHDTGMRMDSAAQSDTTMARDTMAR